MAAEALARKYRPQTFSELVGQDAIAQTLGNAISQDRIHSAYIFTGTRGVGKTSSARILAKALNCVDGPTPNPCSVCDSCREITAGSSVDVLEIDAASHTKVEETRELLSRVAYAPAKGKYRVFIIDEAHMLSKSSFNALLKTLEEPPPHAVFVLATTEPQKILDTVRSRCLEFTFRRIPAGQIAVTLATILDNEGIEFDQDAVDRIAIEADGSMRDGLSLTDQVIGFASGRLDLASVNESLGLTGRDVATRLWDGVFRRDPGQVYELFSDAYRGGADLRRLGVDLAECLRDIIRCVTMGQPGDGLVAEAVTAAGVLSVTDLHRMFDQLHTGLVNLERSPVPDIVLETTLLRLATLEPLGTLEDLLSSGGAGPGASAGGAAASVPSNSGSTGHSAAPENVQPVAASASGSTVVESLTPEPRSFASRAVSSGQIQEMLLREIPSLQSLLAGGVDWTPPRLTVFSASGKTFGRKLLEQKSAEISELVLQATGVSPELVLASQGDSVDGGQAAATGQTDTHSRELDQGSEMPSAAADSDGGLDKRAILEDERLKSLIEAFPGARVVDIRFSQ